jgi:tRNA(adenine34) deaminase
MTTSIHLHHKKENTGLTMFHLIISGKKRVVHSFFVKYNDCIENKERQKGTVTIMTQDEKYMKEAIRQAKKAYALGEVPIGCVIVYQDKIIGRGYNRRNTDKNTLAHAEIAAINKASKKMGDWRLEDCTLYVTLEPCQMCAGAIVQARITKVVMGTMNPKAGCGGSILNILQMEEFNHQVQVERGVLEQECTDMLTDFFKELRLRNKAEKQMRREAQELSGDS